MEKHFRPNLKHSKSFWLTVIGSLVLALTSGWSSLRGSELDQTGTLWAPVIEWSLENSSWSGNPFDLEATATFVHSESGETRRTPMFYDGGNTWRFRFTATRTGTWSVQTASDDSDLNGKTGSIEISLNPDPEVKGFIVAHGQKFAKQAGENGELHGFIPNVYMNLRKFGNAEKCGWTNLSPTFTDPNVFNAYLDEVEEHGSNAAFALVANQWFQIGQPDARGHNSENPDFETFRALEQAIQMAHSRDMHLHIWAWGDESRRWTPVQVGGVNGTPDRRIQRYIAARLGPLPGWTMGYGFDLSEWADAEKVSAWEKNINNQSGWNHLLMARSDRTFPDVKSLPVGGFDDQPDRDFYTAAVDLLEKSGRPAQFERRFSYLRDGVWTMETTRRAFWQFTLAGGAGSIWGLYPPDCSAYVKDTYPEPHQMRTHREFWQNRFRVDMERANHLSNDRDTRVLHDENHAVFYRENTRSIHLNLSDMSDPQSAIAVDTLRPYQEIDLGTLNATSQTWTAPYQSDWVIATGSFSTDTPDPVEPEAPSGLEASAIIPGRIDLAWNAPYTGGSPITGYRVQRRLENETAFTDLETNTGTVGTTYIDFSVIADTTYVYRVSAINEINESAFSNTASATAGDFSQSPLTLSDFGAIGDGNADDTQALREAIAYAGDKQFPLSIPVGRYLITDDIVIDLPVHFVGEGNENSVLTSNGGNARIYIRESGTSFTDLGFQQMIAPIVLESRSGYLLENITFDRCRFENIQVHHNNRGVIGLATGGSSDRPHPIRNLVIKDSVFKNIDSNAVNVRGNISNAQIIDNEFIDIINDPASNSPSDTFVIRLGDPGAAHAAGQGEHLIAGNTIRNIRKSTVDGNLIGILLYGDSSAIRENLIENIDGTDDGLDTNAIYIRGSFNQITDNTIREIRGSSNNGAIHIQGEMAQGNQQNIVSGNIIENIHGMFAIESYSSDFIVSGNEINQAPVGALAHRGGRNLTVSGNTFSSADVLVQTVSGDLIFADNEFLDSTLILSENLETATYRNQIVVTENLFRRTDQDSPNPMIRLADDVAENQVSIHENRFEDLSGIAGTNPLIDLSNGGTLERVEIIGNDVILPGQEAEFAATDSPNETISGNKIVYESNPSPSLDEFLLLKRNEEGDGFSLSWNGKAGFQYQFQFSSDLKNWSLHGDPIPGRDREIRIDDLPIGTGGSMFYRVLIEESET